MNNTQVPSSILKDFNTFIDYFTKHLVILGSRSELLPRKDLYTLNQKLIWKSGDVTPTSPQSRYPILHLFYYLALSGKLFEKRTQGKLTTLVFHPTDRIDEYKKLTPTEQFFFLLETFWIDAPWMDLQPHEVGRNPLIAIPRALEYIATRASGKPLLFKKGNDFTTAGEMFNPWGWGYFLLYLAYFGLFTIELDKPENNQYSDKHSILVRSITPTEFGVTMASILNRKRHIYYWNILHRFENGEWNAIPGSPLPKDSPDALPPLPSLLKAFEEMEYIDLYEGKPEPFFKAFTHLFPKGELEHVLERTGIQYQKGIYLLKVSLPGRVWRIIKISSEHSLLDLHEAIQHAFRFGDDHLYSFFMDNKRWSRKEEFKSPFAEEGPFVDEVCIGELGLFAGKKFLYLFDYGAEWVLEVRVEDIKNTKSLSQKPKVIKSHGESPPQYG